MQRNFRLGNWLIKPNSNEIRARRETRKLEHNVMQLLIFFAENSDRNLAKDEILKGVWGEGVYNEEILTVAVSSLRKALDDNSKNPVYIKTLPRFGYCMLQQPEVQKTGFTLKQLPLLTILENRLGLKSVAIFIIIVLFLLILLAQVAVELVMAIRN